MLIKETSAGAVQRGAMVFPLADIESALNIEFLIHIGAPLHHYMVAVTTFGTKPTLRRDVEPLGQPCPYQRSASAFKPGDNTPRSSVTGRDSHSGPSDQVPGALGRNMCNGCDGRAFY